MATPLLATKLSIPAAPHSLVRRARLLDRLDEGRRRKLTLLSAPAGFGKTTLLAEWVAATRLPAAWVSLDERDNDPYRFWAYVLAALGSLGQGDKDPLGSPGSAGAVEDALAELFDAVLAGIPSGLLLVLDDYHLVTNPALHRALTYLLDHSPPALHVIIASREDPPLPLALLRARGQLVEVRAAELSFTVAEAAAFLQRATSVELPEGAVATLQGRTEGWIAALQLAALSLREGSDPVALVRTFAGTHRYIVDYLAEQVLRQQDAAVQEFLLSTSILDRLSGPLCDAVTGEVGSQATLEWLERANLFLVPLDHDRRWYRYHQLFAGFLQERLEHTHPGRACELHGRAARWYEQQGDAPQAFEHWVLAEQMEEAARLAMEQGPGLLERGEVALFMAWLEQLPHPLLRARPALCLCRAWALAMAGRVTESEACLQEAEQAAASRDSAATAARWEWSGYVAALRAYFAALRGETAQALAFTQVALRELPRDALSLQSAVYNTLGSIYQMLEDVEGATRAYEEALRLARASGSPHIAVPAALNLADIHGQHGRQRLGMAMVREAVDLGVTSGGRALPIAADVYASMAEIAYQSNDLEAAAQHAEKALALSRRGGDADAVVRCALTVAWVCGAQGDVERARSLQREVEQMLHPRATTRVQLGWGAEQAWALRRMRWWIEQGDYSRAAALAEERGLRPDSELNARNEAEHLLLARLYLAEGKPDPARRLLGRLRQSTTDAGRTMRLMEVLVLQALALRACGKSAEAVDTLARALAMAEPEGYIRLFVDEGAPMAELLPQVVQAGHDHLAGYVARLLAALGAEEGRPLARRPQALVEPLSERELEILRLIAAGMAYQEIARELIIAVSTVQYYVKSLYPKLGVHSGLEAVARARQLGLLL